ncbi:hypothetical protein [Butyrivibrio hungatei]|uniref:Uncharacterized protein n=1 Tax=Butyrivibrio hungatei TaxID=185008 RepID=A0A1D9P657_9FIRM|nr:hypothetical protein [Butyrivibrio hungatei]AOZ97804.1 hypothetical protein bhn_II005 [Butyrivibrio hungatei]
MELSFDCKNLIGSRKVYIDTQKNNVIIDKNTPAAAGFIMRAMLNKGASVIVYGKNMDYYRYIYDIAPNYIYGVNGSELINKFSVPFIRNNTYSTAKRCKEVFKDYRQERIHDYMNIPSKKKFFDPNMFQSFFIIDTAGITKRKLIAESLLTSILEQAISSEPIHELCIFMDAPLKPLTSTCIETLKAAECMSNISFVSLYKKVPVLDKNDVLIEKNESKFSLNSSNKRFEVICNEKTTA